MFDAKKKFFKQLNGKNWLITTDDLDEPKVVHKSKNIVLTRDEVVDIANYFQNIIAILDCIKNK